MTGTNPLAIAIPSSDGEPVVADVSMGAVTHGDVLAGRALPEELVPFGGPLAHKAFALAVGLELLVGALAGAGARRRAPRGAPEHDPVPAFRALAGDLRLPGDASGAAEPGGQLHAGIARSRESPPGRRRLGRGPQKLGSSSTAWIR